MEYEDKFIFILYLKMEVLKKIEERNRHFSPIGKPWAYPR